MSLIIEKRGEKKQTWEEKKKKKQTKNTPNIKKKN